MLKEQYKKFIEKEFWRLFENEEPTIEFDKGNIDAVFQGLAQDELFREYLKYLVKLDKQNHFHAKNDEQRAFLRGQIARTVFLGRRVPISTKSKNVGKRSRVGGRYAV